MGKTRQIWSQKQTHEKVITVMGIVCSISIIILAVMQILDIWENAINVFEPLLGVLMVIQTIQNWKKNKEVAIFSLCVAIFIFGISIFIFLTR
ncbi:DUF3953 domain-containing protein [Clostridium sp. YIM B02506]|uniref:DUF3953 domain-containing protein n=1 Tax=Clostridium sp. YIM B02506 TaxID=2910680 RepID=UPI001EEE0B48|nr:DUF3953 domain-containing protein [Clostridium sp. YIM B02506]